MQGEQEHTTNTINKTKTMNREIKFRAWSEQRKAFVSDCYPIGRPTKGGFDLCGIGEDGDDELDDDGLILMQYTGLKDKNGKEIYEGDIIKHRQFEQHEEDALKAKDGTEVEHFGVAKFRRGVFCIETNNARFSTLYLHDIDGNNQILRCWHRHNNLPNIYEGADGFEVIGNIYEHPELLK